jgi:translation elongation factor EF-Tu-like GTPase
LTASKPRIEAKVTFLAGSEGGRSQPARNSDQYRPHIVVGDATQRIAKTADDGRTLIENYLGVRFTGGGDTMEPGQSYEVQLELLYPDVDYRSLVSGATFTIREGGRIVGFGEIKKGVSPAA